MNIQNDKKQQKRDLYAIDDASALFEAIADYLVEVLQNEITTTKTDLTNDDFADYDNDLLEELLDEL